MPVTGLGHDAAEAIGRSAPRSSGQRIAILSATDWLEPGLVDILVGDRHATRDRVHDRPDPPPPDGGGSPPEVDTLVVFLHWGTEDTWCASGRQQDLATALLGAGADVIVGSHAHRVFGAGRSAPPVVAYGLGNFVYWREDGESGRSGVLEVTVTGREVDDLLVGTRSHHRRCARSATRCRGHRRPRGVERRRAADLAQWDRSRGCSASLARDRAMISRGCERSTSHDLDPALPCEA